jgi:hypothetical protein
VKITGMICPECHDTLNCEIHWKLPELWLGSTHWTLCDTCQRFFYILLDQAGSPLSVIDAGPGMGPGDDGYSFDPNVNGAADQEDYDYYMAMEAKRPKCDMCGVREPVKGCKRCKKCIDRFGEAAILTAETVRR